RDNLPRVPARPDTCTYSVRRNAMGLVDRSLVYSRQVQTAYRDGGPGHVVFSVAKKVLWPVCQLGYLMFFEKDLAAYTVNAAKNSTVRLTLLDRREAG